MKRGIAFGTSTAFASILLSGCATTKTQSKINGVEAHVTAARVYQSPTEPTPTLLAAAPVTSEYLLTMPPQQATAPTDTLVEVTPPAIDLQNVASTATTNLGVLQASGESLSSDQSAATEIPINLPSALAAVGGDHPVVGFARWRVQEAYAQLDRAKTMWLPSIQAGMNYRRRDGNYQAVGGEIVDVNLNSLNYGLGTGAVAAGSPTRPGIVAQFHLADALFLPKTAERTAWARSHAAGAALNQQMLDGALAYMDLLEAYQDAEIVGEAVRRTSEITTITRNYAEAGQGLLSDADRTAAELAMLQTRALAAQERQLVASTRLARTLSIPMTSSLVPQDAVAVPLELVTQGTDEAALIASGLAARPELKESQALVAAACEAYKREKVAPFVPSMLLGFSTSSFGGGLGSEADNFGGRYDVDALMVWEVRNLGLGEQAAQRERRSQIQQATFTKLRVMDQVAQQIAEAHAQVGIRRQQVAVSQKAIERARDSYSRNMDRIREGQGLPIEVLQSIQALEAAERAYLRAVVDFNRAQLGLQWALGWNVSQSVQG